jgi:hypothetical protein
MAAGPRLLVWSIEATAGFDTAWAALDEGRLEAEGRAGGLLPSPYWISYRLLTASRFVTARVLVEARWEDGSAKLDLRRGRHGWTVNGASRPDLDEAVDCDLGACPLTNTMPIIRHDLHREAGDHEFLMAFIEVPGLRVVPSRQRYTHIRRAAGAAVVRYSSGSFREKLVGLTESPARGDRDIGGERRRDDTKARRVGQVEGQRQSEPEEPEPEAG